MLKPLQIFTDGASRGNPGPSGVGFVLKQDGVVLEKIGYFLPLQVTNNVAEYLALVAALSLVEDKFVGSPLAFTNLEIFADSELLIKQLKGVYKVKNMVLAQLHAVIFSKLHAIGKHYAFCHIRREHNSLADKMANQGIDKKIAAPEWVAKYL